jgi:protocatechuate 4,5-dioxygenase alpha chain
VSAYELNRMMYDLRLPEHREAIRKDPEAYYRRYDLTEEEIRLLLRHDWNGVNRAGGNIYVMTKLGAALDVSLLDMGAQMRGMDMQQFQQWVAQQGERAAPYKILPDGEEGGGSNG